MHRVVNQMLVILILTDFIIFLNTLLKASPNRKYTNLTFSRTSSLYPKSSPVQCSYFPNSLDDSTKILAASISKSY